jgi:hypothetical protein
VIGGTIVMALAFIIYGFLAHRFSADSNAAPSSAA